MKKKIAASEYAQAQKKIKEQQKALVDRKQGIDDFKKALQTIQNNFNAFQRDMKTETTRNQKGMENQGRRIGDVESYLREVAVREKREREEKGIRKKKKG